MTVSIGSAPKAEKKWVPIYTFHHRNLACVIRSTPKQSGCQPTASNEARAPFINIEDFNSSTLLDRFRTVMESDVQYNLPREILNQMNLLIEKLEIYHDDNPEKLDVNAKLNRELNDLHKFFINYCQKTKLEMGSLEEITPLRDRLKRVETTLASIGAIHSPTDAANALKNMGTGTNERQAKENIVHGFSILKTNLDHNVSQTPQDITGLFEATFTQLNTVSPGMLGQIIRTLKPILRDSTKIVEIFIDQYLTQGVNQQNPLKLFNAMLQSTKIHAEISRFNKGSLDELWKRFYTSQTKFHSLSGSKSIAIFIRETYTEKQLEALFKKIEFHRSKPNQHLAPLFDVFMNHNNDTRLRLITTLFNAKKLIYFSTPVVTSAVPTRTMLSILSQFCLKNPKTIWGGIDTHDAFLESNLKAGNPLQDQFHGTLNLTFLRNVKEHFQNVPPQYQALFVKLVYFAALETPNNLQLSGDVANRELASTAKLSDNLNKLANYSLLQINKFVAKKLNHAALALTAKSYVSAIDTLSTVISHVTSVPQDKLAELEQIRLTQGKQRSGKDAVNELIRQLFKGNDPFNWDVTSINDRVLYLYCYFKYPFEQFREWTESLNKSDTFFSEAQLKTLFDTFDQEKKNVIGLNNIQKYGYKYIQNNQLTTILAARSTVKSGKHFFARQGTGQGKSLTLALLALQFAKEEGKRVMIFSCYDHLAKRDHKTFSQMYSDFGVKSRYIDSPNPAEMDAQVMYANLDSFIKMYYANTYRLGRGENDAIPDFPIFDVDVVLLDEFDALILDSRKIGNTVYNMKSLYPVGNFASTQEAKEKFKDQLSQSTELRNFVNSGWTANAFNQWTSGFSSQEGRQARDYLGNAVSYVGGEWFELSRGNFYLYSSKIDVLTYLLSASTVIGLSGSISEDSMTRIKDAITSIDSGRGIGYLNVPNFYGIDASKNRRVTQNAQLSRVSWRSKIVEDLENCQGRPVLVFGDINDGENWNDLKQTLETYASEKNRKFQIICDEKQTEDLSMVYACEPEYITLASHVVGRGADFKIHPDIDARGGAHACIAAVPNDDYRLFVQMIGRVARMTNAGSHSIILQSALPQEKNDPIEISSFEKELNQVVRNVQKYLSTGYRKENWCRWFLLINIILDQKRWPVSCNSVEDLSVALIQAVTDDQERTIRGTVRGYQTPKPRTLTSKQDAKNGCVVS